MKKGIKKIDEKKKSLRVSLAVHAIILLVGLMPFMSNVKLEKEYSPVIEIAFVNADISSGAASEAPKKIDKPKVEKVEVEKTPKKVDVVTPKATPVVVEEAPAEINVTEVEEEVKEEVVLEETVEEVVEEEVAEEIVEEAPAVESEIAADGEKGEGKEGEKMTGKKLGHMDFEGEGIFGRRVIYRADVKKIAEKEGKVVINLCVNRMGLVSHVAFNREESSITDSDYVKKAMDVASDYLFEKDYSAPETQCGKLSFIFEIN